MLCAEGPSPMQSLLPLLIADIHSRVPGLCVGFGKLFPKNHLLFYSFILRYWAHYSFKGSPLFSTWNTLCAVYIKMIWSFLSRLVSVIALHHHWQLYIVFQWLSCCLLNELWRNKNILSIAADDGWIRTMRSPLTRTALLAFVLPFCCNDTTPDCNLPTKEVSQYNYSWELCLLFSDYSPKLEDTYYSQIIPRIICQSLLM